MMIWIIFLIIFLAGAIGGIINALMTDNGFAMPKYEDASGNKIWRPGVLGNFLTGGVGAVISWGLYGPFPNFVIFPEPKQSELSITVATLVGAILVGVAGAKWLSNEVDKKLLKAAASAAATAKPSTDAPTRMMIATPANALKIAQELNR